MLIILSIFSTFFIFKRLFRELSSHLFMEQMTSIDSIFAATYLIRQLLNMTIVGNFISDFHKD